MRDYAKKKNISSASKKKRTPEQHNPIILQSAQMRGGKINRRLKKLLISGSALLILLLILFFTGKYLWEEKRWRYIVVHHTASNIGNLEYFRRVHMEQRGWSDIAYHFVINNGTANTAMGEIEESSLWKNRLPNFSTRITYINFFGIAVVMVGNFETHEPPPLQREALINLLTNLSRKYNIPPERIVGHREVSPTACPGKFLNMVKVREDVARALSQQSN
jgi:N-acetylmuramoyl-L-alanine amidase